MSFMHPTRLQFSRHEAGHAYAFAALRYPGTPEELGLGVDADGHHHGWCRRRTVLYRSKPTLSAENAASQPILRWQAAAEIVISLAGPLAENRQRCRSRWYAPFVLLWDIDYLLRPGSWDHTGDMENVRSTLRYLNPPDMRIAFQELVGVAHDIVSLHWPKIGKLADLLLVRGDLDADELDDHFEQYPAEACGDRFPLWKGIW